MEKLLIHLYVPAVAEDFDLFVPADLSVEKVIRILATGIEESTNGRSRPSGRETLMPGDGRKAFRPECRLAEYAVRDGDKLILI